MTPPPPSTPCPACGARAEGNFCSTCGASLVPRGCPQCGARLSARARFCHRCGRPVGWGSGPGGAAAAGRPSERVAWLAGGVVALLLVGAIVWKVARQAPAPTVPDMANPGVAASVPLGAGPLPAGPAPDISRMSPRERFDRLFNRVMAAAERGDTATVVGFTPMALGAYHQLDTIDTDARYHAAVLLIQAGDLPAALALADTVLAGGRGHLFGYLIRGEAARLAGDSGGERRAYRDFLRNYEAEMRAGRVEYREHGPALARFKEEAESAVSGKR